MHQMSPEDLQTFVQRLEILRRWACAASEREAERQCRQRPGQPAPAAPLEHVSSCVAPAPVKIARPTLGEIEQALSRIADGLYAVCPDCRGAIARERLLVLPAALKCRKCDGSSTPQMEPARGGDGGRRAANGSSLRQSTPRAAA